MAKTLVTDTDISLSSLHQQLLIKPAASNDSTTVVQIQNSAGTVVLNVDTTNNRVGIGTTSPTNLLTVSGSGAAIRITGASDTSAAYFQFNTSASTGLGYVGVEGSTPGATLTGTLAYATFLSAGSSGSALQLGTPGGIRATITSGGNVGIGTTSPTTAWSRTLQVYNSNNVSLSVKSDANEWHIVTAADGALIFTRSSGYTRSALLMSNGDVGLGGTITSDSALTGASMVIKSGCVGIGTTSPCASLQIGAAVGYNRTSPAIAVPVGLAGFKELIEFGSDSRGGGLTGYQDGSGLVRVSLGTRTSSTVSEQFSVLNSGNVGIGTTSPGYKLEVLGSSNTEIARVGDGTRSFGISTYTPNSGGVTLRNSGTGLISLTAANAVLIGTSYAGLGTGVSANTVAIEGNVGIGISSPTAKLHVAGGKILLDNTQGIQIKDATGTARTVLQVDGGDNLYLDSTAAGGDIYLRASGNDKLTIKATSGNVGIGIATPGIKLDVLGSARVYNSTADAAILIGSDQVDANSGKISYNRGTGNLDITPRSTYATNLVGKLKFSITNSTGAGSALLGANCPAVTVANPYTWITVITSDGSTGYMPIWK